MKFLEGTYIVPTGVGLPMNLTISAVAAVNVQMSGNAQLDQLFSSQELDLAFRLRPRWVTRAGTVVLGGGGGMMGSHPVGWNGSQTVQWYLVGFAV